jgi:hypothetical protein
MDGRQAEAQAEEANRSLLGERRAPTPRGQEHANGRDGKEQDKNTATSARASRCTGDVLPASSIIFCKQAVGVHVLVGEGLHRVQLA